MIILIKENQQLFTLSILLLFVAIFLWILQYGVINYGERTFAQIMRYCLMLKQHCEQKKLFIRLKDNYPKLYHFLSQRFQLEHFYGLPLTLLFLVMGYILALFFGLVEDVVNSNSIVITDYFVSQQMSMLNESSVIDFFILITSLSSTRITFLVVVLTCVICWVMRQRYILVGLLVATLGSATFTFLSKMLFHRERPLNGLVLEHSYSFPSGHATITIALYGFIAYIAIRFSQKFIWKVRIFTTAVLFSVLVGLSRLVLNAHYLSDVLGGYLVGALWLTVAISVTEWLSTRDKIEWHIPWSMTQVYMVWFSLIYVLIGTLIYAQVYQFPFLL
ncbi:phosphatase PAP2 family protein [Psychrobacter frigidicola]|uniref:undecaprenyl-diphosphate phosphatase n=1 Tax=Psychrobacter frigidicola TaxID=45611 RepID=A0A5C7A340_9GAMM|nr:phosphatase PAP2 family protein [Psychrobacter frigidicola]TXD96921.1 phosphatase PAP2 family protein [Psychrobacter frigidicola]